LIWSRVNNPVLCFYANMACLFVREMKNNYFHLTLLLSYMKINIS
jgi:hypothetical protein